MGNSDFLESHLFLFILTYVINYNILTYVINYNICLTTSLERRFSLKEDRSCDHSHFDTLHISEFEKVPKKFLTITNLWRDRSEKRNVDPTGPREGHYKLSYLAHMRLRRHNRGKYLNARVK